MTQLLKSFWTDESGQTMAEYALLLALIAIVVILVVALLGNNIKNVFRASADHMKSHPAAPTT